MEIPIIESDYEEAKRKAKLFYSKIGRIWCPSLKDHVSFNKFGFRHLIWKGGVMRPKNEQKRRLALIVHLERIVSNPFACFEHHHGEDAEFWAFTEEQLDRILKIVIRAC